SGRGGGRNVETVRQKVATNLLAAHQRGQHQAEKQCRYSAKTKAHRSLHGASLRVGFSGNLQPSKTWDFLHGPGKWQPFYTRFVGLRHCAGDFTNNGVVSATVCVQASSRHKRHWLRASRSPNGRRILSTC